MNQRIYSYHGGLKDDHEGGLHVVLELELVLELVLN